MDAETTLHRLQEFKNNNILSIWEFLLIASVFSLFLLSLDNLHNAKILYTMVYVDHSENFT